MGAAISVHPAVDNGIKAAKRYALRYALKTAPEDA